MEKTNRKKRKGEKKRKPEKPVLKIANPAMNLPKETNRIP